MIRGCVESRLARGYGWLVVRERLVGNLQLSDSANLPTVRVFDR